MNENKQKRGCTKMGHRMKYFNGQCMLALEISASLACKRGSEWSMRLQGCWW